MRQHLATLAIYTAAALTGAGGAAAAAAHNDITPTQYTQLTNPTPDYLTACRVAYHRDTTNSGYISFSVTCTSGNGGISSYLNVTAGGTTLRDTGPCAGKYTPSPSYIWVPWYLGGPQRATITSSGWRNCG